MDLSFLRPLYDDPPGADDGYASVYLDTTPSVQDAARRIALRWRSAREELAAAGADDATLDAVGEAVTSPAHDARGKCVFAAAGAVRLSVPLPEPPPRQVSRYAPLPHVLPLLKQLSPRVPHVRVGADRAGGQVIADGERRLVRGEQWPVHKVSTGGWSEQRLQRSAEETWAHNARLTAEAATAAAERVGAEFVVLGGDVRERAAVRGLLPPPLRESTVVVDAEVAPDSAAFDRAAREEAARRLEAATRERLDEYHVRMSVKDLPARRAVDGLAGTLDALRDGLASDVFLQVPGEPPDRLPGDGGAGDGGGDSAGADGDGDGDEARDTVIQAAASTGAGIFLLHPGTGDTSTGMFADGVGALLRAPLAAV